jgi:hypothetical protein
MLNYIHTGNNGIETAMTINKLYARGAMNSTDACFHLTLPLATVTSHHAVQQLPWPLH